MKICIVGAGAIGGFLGARLGASGHLMSAVARGATLVALNDHGLRLEQDGAMIRSPVQASATARDLHPQDLVIVAVKGPAMASVAASIAPLLHDQTMVLVAMNGVPWWFFTGMPGPLENVRLDILDPTGAIAAAIPSHQVIGSVVHASCTMAAPGLARHVVGRGIIVGEPVGGTSPRVEHLAQLLAEAGFESRVSPRIQQDIWFKLWGNMTMNPVSALTGATGDCVLGDPLVLAWIDAMMGEAAAVGDAIGCPIAQSPADRHAITRKLGAFRTSMLQDVEAGRPLEIDALVSAVREIALKVNMATPNIDALLGLTRLFARTRGLYPQ
ncbi:MAG: 2-dehydropantoate 2-reductase [Casimicrobiaceae bacterium]